MLNPDKFKGVVYMSQQQGWPHCESLGGICPLYDLSALLGVSVFDAFMTFLWSAEAGARLTLQKNRDEFTLQVTGAVQRSGSEVISLDQLQSIRARLDAYETHR